MRQDGSLLPKQCDVHAWSLSPRQYDVQNTRLSPRQWFVHIGEVLVHPAQLPGPGGGDGGGGGGGGVACGGGGGGGAGFGLGFGFGCGAGRGVGGAAATDGRGVVVGPDVRAWGSVRPADGVVCADDPVDASTPVTAGDGSGLARLPSVMSVAVPALTAPAPATDPRWPSSVHNRVIAGI
jgi:hypothetical protein